METFTTILLSPHPNPKEIIMWIFSKTGLVSAVRKVDAPDVITVRSRDRISLKSLAACANSEIVKSPDGDYPYRVFIDQNVFAKWAQDIDYDNFKSHVAHVRGYDYAHNLHDVWAAMLRTQDEEALSAP
jgi:hypothetical protein